MLPLRLVIDTNVLVSAALKPAGLQRTVLLVATTKPARLYVSPPILEEYSGVLARPDSGSARGCALNCCNCSRIELTITPTCRLKVASNPDEGIFLECADAARADYLITGNQRHFPRFWKQTKIITSRSSSPWLRLI